LPKTPRRSVSPPPYAKPPSIRQHSRITLNRTPFRPVAVIERLARGARQLSRGGMMLSAAMNGFYGLKQITGNIPADAPATGSDRIVHPDPRDAPLRLKDQGARRKGLCTSIDLPSESDGTA
jgi:hypothetical protein